MRDTSLLDGAEGRWRVCCPQTWAETPNPVKLNVADDCSPLSLGLILVKYFAYEITSLVFNNSEVENKVLYSLCIQCIDEPERQDVFSSLKGV
jgi:hypothetical protein